MDGWIKLHRKLLDNPVVVKDSDYLSVWIWLLLHAEHKDVYKIFSGKKILIKAGQLITTQLYIAKCLHIEESKVRRILKLFKSDGQIDYQTSNKNTVFSILNWNLYQISDGRNAEQMPNKCRTNADDQEIKNIRTKEINTMSESKQTNELFERLWKLYPVKKGKGQVSDAAKKRLLAIGYEEMLRTIDRYKQELDKDSDWRKPQNGSTFFNSGYVDYLDSNYVPSEHRTDKRKKNGFNDFTQRKYDEQELENYFIEEVSRMKGADDG